MNNLEPLLMILLILGEQYYNYVIIHIENRLNRKKILSKFTQVCAIFVLIVEILYRLILSLL